ncbi:hypothetical protein [Kibdelosporangium phytohabitans]|uniref:Uncharacterized protein n=1 Tax=Kibdelosporangium phytohabitans TaxID=860235 RepID=A0A0N9HX16_9PSEU|nr:hypothetical protein [Kibdelosporangium phytohabitans]ALG07681.1 hypothetical protein AOZ06_12865 [Kibdelosporangium phytohabitans]ALG07737.1 hypothetical protein AOZ06_13185 [Kibdelosporangium phytohabitans]MBE1471358.1 RecJ-like exonuclease [Kibdelosporangium phytohabitans]
MSTQPCGTCDGNGKIYDWTRSGDPCPECDGRGFTFAGKVHMKAYNVKQNSGCSISLLGLAAGTWELVYAAAELVSMVTRS